ncbi:MAG TPA: hypothetical protein VLA14_17070 [Polyangia bacterium]|jgi:hypothetical protein|nr:hypothetical protein [Polyangia bacterium]
MSIPPVFFYAIGAFLSVFGAARALVLGRLRPERELSEDTPARAKLRRNHLIFGTLHFVFGIVLILLTSGVLRARLH